MAWGTGPGPITADGCAVDLYAVLPPGDEPDIIASVVPAGGSVLELGAGAGRVTHALLGRGFHVVAVDESAEMLAHITGAETVNRRIEGLDLGRRFDAVLLCSHLINTNDPRQRDDFVAAASRHLGADGVLIIERHPPEWFDAVEEHDVVNLGVGMRLRDVSRPAQEVVAATVEYRFDDLVWTQQFISRRLGDEEVEVLLARHGLALDRWLDQPRAWLAAGRPWG
jgi:SAM-dependent methyltransferase